MELRNPEGIHASIFTFYLNCEAYQSPEEKQRIYTELKYVIFMEA